MSGLEQTVMQGLLEEAAAAAAPAAATAATAAPAAAPVASAAASAVTPAVTPAAAAAAPAAASNLSKFVELLSKAHRSAPNQWDTPAFTTAAGSAIAKGASWLYKRALLPTVRWGATQVATKTPWLYKTALPWILRGVAEGPVIVAGVPETIRRYYRMGQDEQLNPTEQTRYSPEAHEKAVAAGRPSRAYAQSNKPTDNRGLIRFYHDVTDQYDRYGAEQTLREAYAATRLADRLEAIDHAIRYGGSTEWIREDQRNLEPDEDPPDAGTESPGPDEVKKAIEKAHREYVAIVGAGPMKVSQFEEYKSGAADVMRGIFGGVLAPAITDRNAWDFHGAMTRSALVHPDREALVGSGVLKLLADNDGVTLEKEADMIRERMASMVGYKGDRRFERHTAVNTPVDAYLEAFARLEKAQKNMAGVQDYRGKSARAAMRAVDELMQNPDAFDDAAYDSLKTLGEAARAIRMLNPENKPTPKPELVPGQGPVHVPETAEERRIITANVMRGRAFSDDTIGRISTLMGTPTGEVAWARLVTEEPEIADALSGLGIVGSPGRARASGAPGMRVSAPDPGLDDSRKIMKGLR